MKTKLEKKGLAKVLAKTTGCLTVGAFLVSVGCDPIPRRELSAEEKVADMYWMFSKFGVNYAPKEYKAARFGFDPEVEKAKALEEARATKSNSEFYALVNRYASLFQDAHTSVSFNAGSFEDRARVAYLGFTGKRVGENFVVTELLPTISGGRSVYPVQVGDKILKMNGESLSEVAKRELFAARNLGQENANLTFHFPRLFFRTSTQLAMPTAAEVVLKIERNDGRTLDMSLPWVVKDLAQFSREQNLAKAKKKAPEPDDEGSLETFSFADLESSSGSPLQIGFMGFDGQVFSPSRLHEQFLAKNLRYGIETPADGRLGLLDTFRFVDAIAGWAVMAEGEDDEDTAGANNDEPQASQPGEKIVNRVRWVPEDAEFVSEAVIFPAYITWVGAKKPEVKPSEGSDASVDESGDESGDESKKPVGVILVDTFSPARMNPFNEDLEPQDEFKATLKTFRKFGVREIVIDTINNGGGSLVLGMQMAQALSASKLEMPKIQLRMNENWLNDLEEGSRSGPSDSNREYWRRMYENLVSRQKEGHWLSEPFSSEMLKPYGFEPNYSLKKPLKVVLLVNEMCASMCDIFAQILQENGVAQVMGAQTMGAGGNVVGYQQAPNSHFDLRQTESLLLKKDGTYLENNGIVPDVVMDTTLSASNKYNQVIEKALESLRE